MKAVSFLFLLLIARAGNAQSANTSYYHHQSHIYFDLENFREAELYADSALAEVLSSPRSDSLERAYQWLFEIHMAQKDYQKAVQDFTMVTYYRDSTKSEKRSALEAEWHSTLNMEKESHQLDVSLMKEEINMLRTAAERNWLNSLLLVAGMLLLSGIMVFLFYQRGKRAEATVRQLKEEIDDLKSFRKKLFAILSYDLKNSLTSFENLTHSLAVRISTFNKEESIQFLTNLHDTAVELKDTMANVIHWTGFQAETSFHPMTFDCKAAAGGLIEKFQGQLTSKNLTLHIFIPDQRLVFADREMVLIILENLLSNAIHFTPPSGVITCFSGHKDGLVTLGVKDSGMGISPDDVSKLFLPGEDFHRIGKSGHKGAGVGLLLCKDLVERNGGRIYVESTVGQGTTFYFTLPEKKNM